AFFVGAFWYCTRFFVGSDGSSMNPDFLARSGACGLGFSTFLRCTVLLLHHSGFFGAIGSGQKKAPTKTRRHEEFLVQERLRVLRVFVPSWESVGVKCGAVAIGSLPTQI